jgi:N6-adenosine-specific RNA methylase IME4
VGVSSRERLPTTSCCTAYACWCLRFTSPVLSATMSIPSHTCNVDSVLSLRVNSLCRHWCHVFYNFIFDEYIVFNISPVCNATLYSYIPFFFVWKENVNN